MAQQTLIEQLAAWYRTSLFRYGIWAAMVYVSVVHPIVYLLKIRLHFLKDLGEQLGMWLMVFIFPVVLPEVYYILQWLDRKFIQKFWPPCELESD